MPRHEQPNVLTQRLIPEWVERETNDCLRSVGEEVYTARALARHYGAERYPSCAELLRAAEKAVRALGDDGASISHRTAVGERALRKFWEAKVCARRFAERNGR
jgi:hypothetical protein